MSDGGDRGGRSLSGVGRLVRVAGSCVGTEVHIVWYRLRVRFASIKSKVCILIAVHCTIFHDRKDVLRIGIDRSMWVTKVNIDIW